MQIMGLLSMANLTYSSGRFEIFQAKMRDVDAYLGVGINYQMTETDKILFHGLKAILALKENDEQNALLQTALCDEVFGAGKDVQPTVWFSVLGVYFSHLVKCLLYKKYSRSNEKPLPNLKLKKLSQSIGLSLKTIQDFSVKFRSAAVIYCLALGLSDQVHGKKTSAFEDAIDQGAGMKYFVAMAHHWLTVFITITEDTQKFKVNHVTAALDLFVELDVFETMLLWQL